MEPEKRELQKTNEEKNLKKLPGKQPWLPVWNNHLISAQDDPKEVVKIPSPQLHELGFNEKGNEAEGYFLFHAQIVTLVKFAGGDWDKDMAKETATTAYQECNWMTVAEVKLFFARWKLGKYSSNKNFTPWVFMEHLNGYINEVLSNRGGVNAYAWRDNKIPDELFPLSPNPKTGLPGVHVDPAIIKSVLAQVAERFKEAERIQQEEDERARKAKWQGLKNQRDQLIVNLVEHDAAQGIAPDKYMMKKYFECLDRLAGK